MLLSTMAPPPDSTRSTKMPPSSSSAKSAARSRGIGRKTRLKSTSPVSCPKQPRRRRQPLKMADIPLPSDVLTFWCEDLEVFRVQQHGRKRIFNEDQVKQLSAVIQPYFERAKRISPKELRVYC